MGLGAGSYVLHFEALDYQHSDGYYSTSGFKYFEADASLVVLDTADVSGIDIVLPLPVHARGKIAGVSYPTGSNLQSVAITLHGNFPSTSPGWPYYSPSVATDGTWDAIVIPGPYTIDYQDTHNYFGHCWYTAAGCVYDKDAADTVNVTTDGLSGIEATLPLALSISGSITDANGLPVPHTNITAYADGLPVAYTYSTGGEYVLYLIPGKYTLGFSDPTHDFTDGWYGASGYTRVLADAAIVELSSTNITAIDVTMPYSSPHLMGKVTDSNGTPLPGIRIYLGKDGAIWGSDLTIANGTFSWALQPGNYTLKFDGGDVYASGWYSASGLVYDEVNATVITIASENVVGISVALPPVPHISGTVSVPGGQGLAGIDVSVFDADGFVRDVVTGSDGSYSIKVVPGRYTVGFYDDSNVRAPGWYSTSGFTTDEYAASELNVTAAGVTGIDVSIPVSVVLSGKVSKAGGTGLPYVEVDVYSGDSYYGYVMTNSNGTFAMALGPGSYSFWFYDWTGAYAPGWYSTTGYTSNSVAASHINVSSSNVNGINLTLPSARHIRGKVSGADVGGLADAYVEADKGGSWTSFAYSFSDGTYSMPIAGGSYTLWFEAAVDVFASGWYRSSGYTNDSSQASVVTVSSSDVTGKNVTLPAAHVLSGRVTNAVPLSLPGIYVTVWVNGHAYLGDHTAIDGSYAISVPPGIYKVAVYDDSGAYLTGWYSSAGFRVDSGSATGVTVSSDNVGDINVQMPAYSVPGAPTSVSATPYNNSAAVEWTPPVSDGYRPITGYVATAAPGGAACSTTGALSCTVENLTNGTPYTLTVRAVNALGPSDPSDPASATPVAVPDAPTNVAGVALATSVVLTWGAPDDNGSAITGYNVTVTPGGGSCSTSALTCTFTGLTTHTAYTFAVTATNGNGTGPAGSVVVTPRTGNSFFPLTPTRILDTKTALGLPGVLTAYVPATFQVTGLAGVPSTATAVTGVLSVSAATKAGFLSLTSAPPVGAPTTSTINFPANDARATGVTATLSATGSLWLTYGASVGTMHAAFDVTGYFVLGTSGAKYVALTPNRIVDTRVANGITTGKITAGTHAKFQVTGRVPTDVTKNVPAGAVAITGTLTVTGQTAPGYLSLGPDPIDAPSTTTLAFIKGDNRATGITIKLAPDGSLNVVFISTVVGAKTDVVFDVNGYFLASDTGAMFVPLTNNRLVDTRYKIGLSAKLTNMHAATFQVTGRVPADVTKNVPTGAVAITGTLTVAGQSWPGFLSLTNIPVNNPTTSTLNFPKGDDRATGVTVPLSSAGKLSVTYGAIAGATTHCIFDVSGYFVN
jgi:hypothetical protein